MKKIKIFGILIFVVILVVAAPFVGEFLSIVSYDGVDVAFVIEDGAAPAHVAQKLEDEGIIKSKYTFIIRYKLGSYDSVYAGTHTILNGMSLGEILKVVTSPAKGGETVSFTIPEGYSVEMIAQRAEECGLCSYNDFVNAVNSSDYNYEFINHIPDGTYKYKLEGFLFPNTYEFFKSSTAHDIVDKLLGAFDEEYRKYFSSYDRLFEIMTVASIVEREAVLDSERATIAGVIQNRLETGMLLQVDATVVYAKSAGLYDMTVVTYEDLEVDSPYNTYKYQGLTPGPICNPGIKSVIAAASPESHDYLFYHTDEVKKDGSHIFTKNFDEHLETMN